MTKNFLMGSMVGVLLGIYLEAHHPQMFRSWYDEDKTLYRGDKVTLHVSGSDADRYKNCYAKYIAGQAVDDENMAWVLFKNCDGQQPGILHVETFRLRDLEKINE